MKEQLVSGGIALAVAAALVYGASRVEPEPMRGKWVARRRAAVEAVDPRVVMIGNSLVEEGIDDALFSEVTGVRTLNVAKSGSGTAIWYLLLKNVVVASRPRPELAVVFFADGQLTDPYHKTQPPYDEAIETLSVGFEPVVEHLLYERRDATPWQMRFEQSRARVRELSERGVKNMVSRAMGRDPKKTQKAIEKVFGDDQMQFEVINQRQLAADEVHRGTWYDFPSVVEDSFLPAMIELCRENHMALVFVRLKRRQRAEGLPENSVLAPYMEELAAYLEREGIPFIDYTHDDRITIDLYAIGDHLDHTRGKPVFTRYLADALAPYLPR